LEKNKRDIIILAVIIIVISVIFLALLYSQNRFINDDDEFYRTANIIVDDLYPITEDNIIYKGYKASDYRLEIKDYSLSPSAESVRENLDFALEYLGTLYDTYPYIFDTSIDIVNRRLEWVRDSCSDY